MDKNEDWTIKLCVVVEKEITISQIVTGEHIAYNKKLFITESFSTGCIDFKHFFLKIFLTTETLYSI